MRISDWSSYVCASDLLLHETLIKGVNDEHLAVTIDRLNQRYGDVVDTRRPSVAYKESFRKPVTQRGRHKKQSGGHGQFGDVVIEVRPLGRGEGFRFDEKITGGAVPKQWIPAVEQGIRDATVKGPLGFPVVDVAATLVDGRSEEHTSELQSLMRISYAVFCLNKKTTQRTNLIAHDKITTITK